MNNYVIFLIFEILVWNSFCHATGGDYSYKDIDAWGDFSPICKTGRQQSPIELGNEVMKIKVNCLPVEFVNYTKKPESVKVLNDGHTANLTAEWTQFHPYITGPLLNNDRLRFLDLHVHWSGDNDTGTEHSIRGKKYAVELHLIHINVKYANLNEALNQSDGVAVVAMLFKINKTGHTNPGIDSLSALDSAVTQVNAKVKTEDFDLSLFNLRSIRKFYTYVGSLTTPPCTQNVRWIVAAKRYPVNMESVESLRDIHLGHHDPHNIRPLQPINNREVYLYKLIDETN